MNPGQYTTEDIERVELVVGMEVHVELATASKMFSRAPNPACAGSGGMDEPEPNSLVDPVVLALPGALPVMNRAAVEMSMRVGLALGCRIAAQSRWDRKSYFYPDLPKAYQISQYDRPLCEGGVVEVPAVDARGVFDLSGERTRVRVLRAHLEEDAGKLLHELPGGGGGGKLDGSIVDLNRAGTPLLEIVTEPDFRSAAECVAFARLLRLTCRFLGVTEGVMQRGHMRFEPNINCRLVLRDGREVATPIVEIKNLNSFRALGETIEYELREQPGRWVEDGRELGAGTKTTRGWDAGRGVTVVQREKEDAHDYRYFPDPDLPEVCVDEAWCERVRAGVPELPLARMDRYAAEAGVNGAEAAALVEDRETAQLYDAIVEALVGMGRARADVARAAANLLLQQGFKLANERGVAVGALGFSAAQAAGIVGLRLDGDIAAAAVEVLLVECCEDSAAVPREVAAGLGLLVVRDAAQLEAWCDEVIAAQPEVADQVRRGKVQAVGRLIGQVMARSGGTADAKEAREMLLRKLAGA
ncbi:MAG: Asp-tRNA(Asn)/Glu-tRNA(Gln) amidotransferase subunit GatB [Planctomycetota bacterium]|nr:Asp-tRNA(Asn)/Glu-tRNA(Gln) amidotransferase subunit GatB [Planctomycetota bacterium]